MGGRGNGGVIDAVERSIMSSPRASKVRMLAWRDNLNRSPYLNSIPNINPNSNIKH